MIDVTVKVPEDRVAEFYSMYGNWLAEPGISDGPQDELSDWKASDTAAAKAVWSKFSDTAKGLFTTLMDSPGSKFSGDELAAQLGIPNGKHGVAGVLAWPGRYCFAEGRNWLWQWDYPVGGNARYWMSPEVSSLFSQARETSP